jgi:hypothetical protein
MRIQIRIRIWGSIKVLLLIFLLLLMLKNMNFLQCNRLGNNNIKFVQCARLGIFYSAPGWEFFTVRQAGK